MRHLRLLLLAAGIMATAIVQGATAERTANGVTVRPDGGQARVIRLQVVSDWVIRVRATSADALPQKPKSLMISLPKAATDGRANEPTFDVEQDAGKVRLRTARIQAVVDCQTGRVAFYHRQGAKILSEADDGKRFWPYRVPDCEIGVDADKVDENQLNGLTWQLVFDNQQEALYGLGQHQSEELNMKGKNEELFQYNTKVSVPFVISNKNYGILWDAYCFCRFGQPEDYLQLNRAFPLYDKQGAEGHLTGTYTDKNGRTLVRQEDSIYYEYDLPERQRAADAGGIKNLPKGFNLDGATVVYEGYLEPKASPKPYNGDDIYQLILYYAGYMKVYIGGQLVVPERWRTAWNPNAYKFEAKVPEGRRTPLRIEWQPDGSVSYCGLRVARPRTSDEKERLSIWSEMAQDMDYYFIAGRSMDEVISGYRLLTGRAPVFPKWALGYWQSRERYKTQKEIEGTFREFRNRHIPIDNIVQDWNYWPEDQWGSHRFESSRYPDPQQMLDSVHQMHGRFMISVWPKFYCNTDNYKELDAKGWMYHQAVADDIHDWVGPGYVGSFYDAYSEGAREMFWRQMDENLYTPQSANRKSENRKSFNGTQRRKDTKNCTQSEKNLCDLASLRTNDSIENRKSFNGTQRRKDTKNCTQNEKNLCDLASLRTNDSIANRKSENRKSIDAWWMDASEPNVRDCTPMWYRKALCGPTALGTSTEYFNAYSLVNAEAIYNGQRGLYAPAAPGEEGEGEPSPRVFLLTRSGFAGLQRYSTATWSGDIGTRWEDMRAQMTAGMNYSLSGLPFWGMDQGGFCVESRYVKAQKLYDKTKQENDDLKEWRELQARWSQFGTFVPLFRAHGQWPFREPWHIAPDSHPAYRSFVYYDKLRYRLMPYLYSMAGWVHLYDYTMMRALVMDFNGDDNVCDIKDQWMFGPSLMACPVSAYKARSRSVWFPRQCGWYDLYTGEQIIDRESPDRRRVVDAPYDRIPVFVPGGSIIPFGPAMEWSDEKPAGLINLYVYAGRDARFTLYEDEGTNYRYELGEYSTIDIFYDDRLKAVTFGRREGRFDGMLSQRRFNIVYITESKPRPLDLDSPAGVMVEYDGSKTVVSL